jgi:hypothetical protein
MIFRAGSETVAVVSLDLLGFPSVLGDRARAMVPRLAPDRILIGFPAHSQRTGLLCLSGRQGRAHRFA